MRSSSASARILRTSAARSPATSPALRKCRGPNRHRRKRALNHEQATALLEAVKGDPLEAFVVVGAYDRPAAGRTARPAMGAISTSTPARSNVSGSLKREGSTLRLGDVKRGIRRSRRRIDLHDRAVSVLRPIAPRSVEQRLLVGPDWQDYGSGRNYGMVNVVAKGATNAVDKFPACLD